MISIVKRASLALEADPMELTILWEECLDAVKAMGYGRLSAKTFAVAAKLFTEQTGVALSLQQIRRFSRSDPRVAPDADTTASTINRP